MKNQTFYFIIFQNFVFILQWLTIITLTFAILFLIIIDESVAVFAEPQAPNFQYFER